MASSLLFLCADAPLRINVGTVAVVHVYGCAASGRHDGDGLVTFVLSLDQDAHMAARLEAGSLTHRQVVDWQQHRTPSMRIQHGASRVDCHWDLTTIAALGLCPMDTSLLDRLRVTPARPVTLKVSITIGDDSTTRSISLAPSALGVAEHQERWLAWNPTPMYLGGVQPSVAALGAWAAAWRDAGFADVHIFAREDVSCQLARRGSILCEQRSTIAGLQGRAARYHDLDIYCTVGLVYARTGGYGAIAFADLDERPGPDTRSLVRRLKVSRAAFMRAFFRSSWCAPLEGRPFCPRSDCDIELAVHSGRCQAGLLANANAKIIGIPSRMRLASAHSAWASSGAGKQAHLHRPPGCTLGRNWRFETCWQNVSVFHERAE